MRVQASVAFYLKDIPKGEYIGITSENWNFGKEKAVPFDGMVYLFAKHILDFYMLFTEPEELNQACDKLAKLFSEWRFAKADENHETS